MSVLHYLKEIKDFREAAEKVKTPPAYTMERLEECINGLFSFAKFNLNDYVEMAETYPVNEKESPGWMHCRHLLVKGGKAIVRERDWYKDGFSYRVEFLEKSWIDDKDKIHKQPDPANLWLREKWLAPTSMPTTAGGVAGSMTCDKCGSRFTGWWT